MNENLIFPAFTRKRLDEEKAKDKSKVITVRLNKAEQKLLKQVKKAINQPKDGTALKTMFVLASFDVLHDQKTRHLIQTLFKNKLNNERTGAASLFENID